ncbi:acylphosphatase-2-like isoform X4 [Oratosquilla oratoria]|uniref:acylphosphatase-2-like isoform X4 n=1 Tax=Oratosquilla oratoria TaxID=337810 RepID=UPI003F757A40
MAKLIAVDFEVFGRVQAVHLPTESSHCILIHRAKLLIHPGKDWLRNTGSPSSRITKAEFRNEKEIEAVSFSHFNIKH